MINDFIGLPAIIGGSLSMSIALLVGMGMYFSARAIVGSQISPEVRQLGTNMFMVLATLVSLMLSLTFADLRAEIGDVRRSAESETALIGDLYNDLERFGSTASTALGAQLVEYVRAVVEVEWPSLARGNADTRVFQVFRELEKGALLLDADTPLRAELRDRMLADLDRIAAYRAERVASSLTATPVFLLVAILGYLWSSALLCVYEPKGKALLFIGAYFMFFGLVTYLMVALSNFFTGFGAVFPYPFEVLLEWEQLP